MEQTSEIFQSATATKANFDDIYMSKDPREYYRVLFGLDYVIPDLAKDVFRAVVAHRGAGAGRPLRILDIGCSYGVNAALIRYPLDLARIAGQHRRCTKTPERREHGCRVCDAGLDDDNVAHDASTPFVLGTESPSIAIAWRSARARALNAASAL